MTNRSAAWYIALCYCAALSCQSDPTKEEKKAVRGTADTATTNNGQTIQLPEPYATESVQNFSNVIGWPADKTPIVPEGFTISRFATGLNHPRWIYVGPNGDVFIAESNTEPGPVGKIKNKLNGKEKSKTTGTSANRITILRDADKDGQPEIKQTFLSGLNQPFGMLIIDSTFYVANTDGLLAFAYQPGALQIKAPGKKIVALPAGGYNNHWTRNIITNAGHSKIYITVGSGSNVGEHGMENEIRRANILEVNPDGSGEVIYASGLRNPQGMGWAPGTTVLWTAVNERDELGDELVPDYLTSVKKGGFYGWPYAYFGQHEDPRLKGQQPDLVKKTIVPDVPLGSHTASLGLAFDSKGALPGKYSGGAFIAQHGSWNSSKFTGYQVAFVPFKNGKATGTYQPFVTGFIADEANKKVYGRPVGLAFNQQNELLIADDAGNTIWLVRAAGKQLQQ